MDLVLIAALEAETPAFEMEKSRAEAALADWYGNSQAKSQNVSL